MPDLPPVRIEVTCVSCPLQMDVWITEDSDYPDDAITHRFYYRARHGKFSVVRYPIADGTIMSGNDDGKDSISVAVARVIEAAREVGVFMVMP